MIAGATYFARVRAINWASVASPYALGAVVTASGVITISANRLTSVWYNATDVIFNAQGAVNYHYRVSANPADAATLGDPLFDGSAITVTMLQGISYFFVLGVDGGGSAVGATRFGPVELDTGTPTLVAVAAQVSAADPTAIISGGTTLSTTPRFSWTLPASTSPIVGYSYLLSINPLATPPLVVNTTLRFADVTLSASGLYYFTVLAENLAGDWGPTASFNFNFTSIPLVSAILIKNNYFNPVRGVCMGVNVQTAAAGHVKIEVYTMLGRKVATVADAEAGAGTFNYSWCGRTQDNQLVGTGTYLLRVEAPQQKKNFKVIVVK